MKRRIKRIVSIILTIALLVISLPVAKAESNNIKDGMIASFMPLEDHIQTQLVPLGTKEIDLNLPETITVNKYQGEAVEQAKNAVEEPIHWQSEPRYDETKAGEYHFTPELDNNMISHGVQLPSITIQVIEETNTLESVSNTSNNAQTVLNRNVSGITNIPISIGGVERDEDYAVITINGNQDKYIQGYYRLVDFNTSEPELNDQDRKFSVNELDLELEIDGLDKEKKYDLWFQLEDTQTMEQYKFKIEIPAYRDKGDVLFVVSGNSNYIDPNIVTITADSAPKYMVFDKWVGGDDSIFSNGSRTDATTTIVMPDKAVILTATYKHNHEFDTVWHSDETNHWHECLAKDQEISDQQTHQYGAWIVDQEPTLNKQGSQYRSCEVCGYEDRQSIDQLVTAYNKRTLTDSISGIQVSGSFSDDAQLEVIGENVLHKEGTCQVCDELRKQQDQLILLYDIHLKTGSYQGAIEVSIPVDEKYNGQSVMLLHCNNQVLESKALVVEHGMVKGTFSSLSPYAIRIIQQKEVEEPVIIKATGQTQTETIICMLTWILVLASLVGYGVLMLRKNHKK